MSDADYEDSDDAETGEDSHGGIHKCPGCDNVYVNQKSLKVDTSNSTHCLISLTLEQRHLSDRRSVCSKNIHEPETKKKAWACPRCDVQMRKKYSLEVRSLATWFTTTILTTNSATLETPAGKSVMSAPSLGKLYATLFTAMAPAHTVRTRESPVLSTLNS